MIQGTESRKMRIVFEEGNGEFILKHSIESVWEIVSSTAPKLPGKGKWVGKFVRIGDFKLGKEAVIHKKNPTTTGKQLTYFRAPWPVISAELVGPGPYPEAKIMPVFEQVENLKPVREGEQYLRMVFEKPDGQFVEFTFRDFVKEWVLNSTTGLSKSESSNWIGKYMDSFFDSLGAGKPFYKTWQGYDYLGETPWPLVYIELRTYGSGKEVAR